jgi:N-acetylglucosamine-6-sulfatase
MMMPRNSLVLAAALLLLAPHTHPAVRTVAVETAVAATLADATSAATSAAASPTSPDIIVVMVDDLGYIPDDRVVERLPAIRALWLEGGSRFTNLYTETPLCCPARATLLTGRHTLGHGVITNDGDPLDPSLTIATALDSVGYHTMLMGKYLNEYEGTRTPPGWDRVMMRERNVGASFSIDGEPVTFPDMHFDDALREQAVTWLREAPIDEPVLALISPRAPHRHPQKCERGDRGCQYLPLVMEEDQGSAACADIPSFRPPNYEVTDNRRAVPWVMPDFPDGWPLGDICASLLVVDRMVGGLLEAQAARERPAYFVFLSDNGMSWGQKAYPQKHVPTATRLPFYVSGPGVPTADIDVLLSNLDIAPTLAELGGTSLAADGASFVPLLEGSVHEGLGELLEVMPADPDGFYEGWAAIRTPDLRFIRWDSGLRELYDVRADEWELDNLVESRADVAAGLEVRLDELLDASRE